jgi:hypothetical protein
MIRAPSRAIVAAAAAAIRIQPALRLDGREREGCTVMAQAPARTRRKVMNRVAIDRRRAAVFIRGEVIGICLVLAGCR